MVNPQRGKQRLSEARRRIISENGLQLVAKDFKEVVCISGMTDIAI
jgi:hypothetical protein